MRDVMNGRSHADGWWWGRLGRVVTLVAEDRSGQVVGACSYAVDLKDGTGYVLWSATADCYGVAKSLTKEVRAASSALQGRVRPAETDVKPRLSQLRRGCAGLLYTGG